MLDCAGALAVSNDFELIIRPAPRFGFLFGEQRHAVGDRDLIIVRVDFGKREEALAVSSVFNEGRLQGRLHARYLGKINIAFERSFGGGLEIKFFDLLSVENDHPGFFRVACIDEHTLGHHNLHAPAQHTSPFRAPAHGFGSRRMRVALFGAEALPLARWL